MAIPPPWGMVAILVGFGPGLGGATTAHAADGAHMHVAVGPPTAGSLADRTAGRWSIDHRTCRTGRCGSSDGLTHPVQPGTTFVTGSAIPLAEG